FVAGALAFRPLLTVIEKRYFLIEAIEDFDGGSSKAKGQWTPRICAVSWKSRRMAASPSPLIG
ncbi:hypothetical protein, partial [Mesorhizobium sp. M2A.F.Ca.ET.042.01.1.1]|uniref:hypothetical protein n=1 Tax=Mesorhizobium sp. M2A.F.Ca.ET.042.01.1.1 TaxID=2496745 RepID=UPI001AEC7F82